MPHELPQLECSFALLCTTDCPPRGPLFSLANSAPSRVCNCFCVPCFPPPALSRCDWAAPSPNARLEQKHSTKAAAALTMLMAAAEAANAACRRHQSAAPLAPSHSSRASSWRSTAGQEAWQERAEEQVEGGHMNEGRACGGRKERRRSKRRRSRGAGLLHTHPSPACPAALGPAWPLARRHGAWQGRCRPPAGGGREVDVGG